MPSSSNNKHRMFRVNTNAVDIHAQARDDLAELKKCVLPRSRMSLETGVSR